MKKIIFLIFILIASWNCQGKRVALGDSGMLHVFADSTHWEMWEEAVNQVFGKTKEMPYPEPEFRINFHHADEFPLYKNRKNLLILGYLDGKDNASLLANKMLTIELQQGIKDGKYFYFQKEDLWANGQFLLIGVGRDKTDVFSQLLGYKKQMVDALRNNFYTKLHKSMFSRGEQKNLEKEILENHDFGIRMQVDYQVVLDEKKDNFFLIRRYRPDRFLFVHYLENKSADFITSENIIALRDSLGKKHLKGDFVAENYTKFFPVNFNGYKALKIEGVWNNNDRFIGGPFRTYAFFDSITSRVYLVDFHVFKPDGLKKAYIDQLEIIANSFKLKHKIKNLDDPWNPENKNQ